MAREALAGAGALARGRRTRPARRPRGAVDPRPSWRASCSTSPARRLAQPGARLPTPATTGCRAGDPLGGGRGARRDGELEAEQAVDVAGQQLRGGAGSARLSCSRSAARRRRSRSRKRLPAPRSRRAALAGHDAGLVWMTLAEEHGPDLRGRAARCCAARKRALALARRQRVPDVACDRNYEQQGMRTGRACSHRPPRSGPAPAPDPGPQPGLSSGEVRGAAPCRSASLRDKVESALTADVRTAWATSPRHAPVVERSHGRAPREARAVRETWSTYQHLKGAVSLSSASMPSAYVAVSVESYRGASPTSGPRSTAGHCGRYGSRSRE